MSDDASSPTQDIDSALQVMTARSLMMLAATVEPTAERQAEMVRMLAEKQIALVDGLVDAQCAVADAVLGMWSGGMTAHRLAALPMVYWTAFQAPALAMLASNAKRLNGPRI